MASGRSGAVGAIVLAAAVVLAFGYRLAFVAPALDASFPSAPSPAEMAALRRAYSGEPATWPRPRLLPDAKFVEMGALKLYPRPQGNELAKAQLGGDLFNDPRLSASGHVACQSCHNRRLGWGDGLPTSFGHARTEGRRNAPSLFSSGYKTSFFWDGRASSLEEQALGPLTDMGEMANAEIGGVAQRVGAVQSYRDRFSALTERDNVELGDVTVALAAFQRTLERTTRFDRFAAGDQKALSDKEVLGLHLFRTKAGCANCHNGPLLSDGEFHNIGLSYFGRKLEDLGRYGVTGKAADAGSFRTPSLRHVSETGPYMHNGVMPTLTGIVGFYAGAGGRVRDDRREEGHRALLFEAAQSKSKLLQRFTLTHDERDALVAFLRTL